MSQSVPSLLNSLPDTAVERRPTVILLAELRGFTSMSEMLEPALVLELVSGYFGMVSAAVERNGGSVAQVVNDTLRATFPADAGAAAVQAAQDIQIGFAPFEESWSHDYGLKPAVAFGLHRGDAVFGTAGSPGLPQRIVFGECMSIAERMLHRARAGEFVLSEAVMLALSAGGTPPRAEVLPPLELPRRTPLKLYGVQLDTQLDFTAG
jgi:adenylate cyclase